MIETFPAVAVMVGVALNRTPEASLPPTPEKLILPVELVTLLSLICTPRCEPPPVPPAPLIPILPALALMVELSVKAPLPSPVVCPLMVMAPAAAFALVDVTEES